MAKREVWVEEEDGGRVTGAWFSKPLAMRHVRNGCKVTRYVPDEPATEGWEAWAVLTEGDDVVCVSTKHENAKANATRPGDRVVKVRAVPVEVKARKRKGGAK